MSPKIELDGPLWRIYMQDYFDTDGKKKFLFVWKSHHSFCDGVSIMSMVLSLSSDYSRDFFVKSTDVPWYGIALIRMMVPLQLPKLVMALF